MIELDKPGNSGEENQNHPYLNIRALYASCLDSYKEYWDDELPFALNVQSLFEQCVLVPNGDIQYPVMTAYSLLPTHLCNVLPIAFSYGCRGSAKTTASVLCTYVRGIKHIFSPGDTFASSRNLISKMRFYDELEEIEKPNCAMVWDNLNEEILSDSPKLYNVILAGYNRASAKVRIADKSGENLQFDVFCPKWFSSVTPLHQIAKFNELGRRLILFIHKPLDQFSDFEKTGLKCSVDDLIDLDSINFEGLGTEFCQYWENEERMQDYISVRQSLMRRRSRLMPLPAGFDPAKRSMCLDMVTTMVVSGLVQTAKDGIELLHEHFLWCDTVSSSTSIVLTKIENYVQETLGHILKVNEQLMANGLQSEPLEIKTSTIHNQLNAWYRLGEIDIVPTVRNYRSAFEVLGWVYTGDSFVKR